ncbi:MAG: ATP-binding cassette domain-containing protein [Bacteroidetes bacterium]|nr:ATP-binding cassette domain-containing protein [Bacteroidota bacterium]
MIQARNISKAFGNRPVLKNVSFDLEPGKCNLIIGESGSGKTVFTKCMVGLLKVDSGEVLYDNRNFTTMSFYEKKVIRKEIGMLFQGGALFDSMTVEENIIFPLSMFTDKTQEEKRERANFCLNRVNLPNAASLLPSELSGGMKKRVAIARAIAVEPRYLICDEPNSGLDPRTSIVIDELIKEITYEYNITTLVITHDMNSVLEIGDNIAFLYNGEILWKGNKEQILHAGAKELVDFVYATKFLKEFRKRVIQ